MPLYRIVGVILKPVQSSGPWGWLIGIFMVVAIPVMVIMLIWYVILSGVDAVFGTHYRDSQFNRGHQPETHWSIGGSGNDKSDQTRKQTWSGRPGQVLVHTQGNWRAINMTAGLRAEVQDGGFFYGYFEYVNFGESDRGRTLNVEAKSQDIAAMIELWNGNISGDDRAWWTQHQKVATSSGGLEHNPHLRWEIAPGAYTLFFPAFTQSGEVSNLPFYARLNIGSSEITDNNLQSQPESQPSLSQQPPQRGPNVTMNGPDNPSENYRTFSNQWFSVSVPVNWRETRSGNAVTFYPTSAYSVNQGRGDYTHAVMFAVARMNGYDLRGAAEQYATTIVRQDNYLRRQSTDQSAIAGRDAVKISFSGVSNVTGRVETVTLYCLMLRDGSSLFMDTVAPADDSGIYGPVFQTILQSLALHDR